MNINDVLTIQEAVRLYNVASTTLRQRLERSRDNKGSFEYGVDCRKTCGKRGEWLVTKSALEKYYQKREQQGS